MQKGRYKLLIMQCLQLAGYDTEENAESEQKIVLMFASDDQKKVAETAKGLKGLSGNAKIVIFDSNTGARVIVK